MPNKKSFIPHVDFGGTGPVLHFAHANGFPPLSYQQFLQPFLKKYQITASTFRPLWGNQEPESLHSWEMLADDMIRFLEERKLKNIVGMGHSLGGVCSLIAAMKRPDLFSKLILLDPVIFDAPIFYLLKYLPFSIRKKIVPPAKISINRRDRWNSKEEVYEWWRKKRVFERIPDTVLQDIIEQAIVPDGKGKMTLSYSKYWETQVYITVPLIFKKIKKIKTPLIVLKGEDTNVITAKVWESWKRAQPQNHFITFPETGHLLPFERPEELAEEILKYL